MEPGVVEDLFHLLDESDDGSLDFKEFLLGFAVLNERAGFQAAVRLAFKVFDPDGKGWISLSALDNVLGKAFPELGAAEIAALGTAADTDHNGQ